MARKKTKNKPANSIAWMLLSLGMLMVGVLAAYVKYTPAGRVPDSEMRSSTRQISAPQTSVNVLTPHYVEEELKFDKTAGKVEPGQDKAVYVVNSYLAHAGITPKDAKLVSCTIEGGVAKLNFSRAFRQTYGTEDEHTLIEGILVSLGQFPEIHSAQFLVEGKAIDSLGNIDLSDPQPVIRK